ncbi:MAG: hypothetical protein GHCLOJNM_00642 [bacterium]|nr:hypothetical protein [bacterium]
MKEPTKKDLDPRFQGVVAEAGSSPSPAPLESPCDEALDWDLVITPQPRGVDAIQVKFRYVGRGRPLPIDDPMA